MIKQRAIQQLPENDLKSRSFLDGGEEVVGKLIKGEKIEDLSGGMLIWLKCENPE